MADEVFEIENIDNMTTILRSIYIIIKLIIK